MLSRFASLALFACLITSSTASCSEAPLDAEGRAVAPIPVGKASVFATTPGATLAVAVVGPTVVWSSDSDGLYSMDSTATKPMKWTGPVDRVPSVKPTKLVATESELFWTGDGLIHMARQQPGVSGFEDYARTGGTASELMAVNGQLIFTTDIEAGSIVQYDRTSGETIRIYEGKWPAVAIAADARNAYLLDERGVIVVARRGGSFSALAVPLGGAKTIAADEDGLFLVAAANTDADGRTTGSVLLRFDAARGTYTRLTVAPFEPSEVRRIATDRASVYVLGRNELWKFAKSGNAASPILYYASNVTDIAVAPDGVYCSVSRFGGTGAVLKIEK